MKSHDDRVNRLNETAKEIMEQCQVADRIQKDLDTFNTRWGSTCEKIGRSILIIPPNYFCQIDIFIAVLFYRCIWLKLTTFFKQLTYFFTPAF